MCGIVGMIGHRNVAPLLLQGLHRLEYRGYDSAGIATVVDGRIECRRAEGKLDNLERRLEREPISGTIGIGHTRWATHGVPNETNAHPIATTRVAVVHNGIIENFRELHRELAEIGFSFETETDTEVIALLLTHHLSVGFAPREAVRRTLKRLEGTFAIVILFAGHQDFLICARRGSPLAIGYGEREMFIGSDAIALAPLTRKICYLEEGDWAMVTAVNATLFDASSRQTWRAVKEMAISGRVIGKGNHCHFMHKEIFEQPAVIGDTLRSLQDLAQHRTRLSDLPFELANISRVTIVACGTSFHAGLVAKYWIERLARVRVEVEIASEFRYRAPHMSEGELSIFISQSGETADTLAALRWARLRRQRILAVVNQVESSIAREADAILPTLAGPEIGVASTKAFTTQLAALACLTIILARARGVISNSRELELTRSLAEAPAQVSEALAGEEAIRNVAEKMQHARHVLYLGRGTAYPLAMEGALKLKEISYIHAEGYAAGEMKHGPIALIDHEMPIVVLAPPGKLFQKTLSNVQEVMARGGRVIMISDRKGLDSLGDRISDRIEVPTSDPFVAPLIYAIPIQLFAYHVAVLKGTDVDQPRNLAKSVTVE
jgi:glucosamine--fructose-6-phosphate aminotransferase (isomerizing)